MTDTPIAVELADERATAALASDIAVLARPGDVIGLAGDLGAGKTAFARAFLRSYCADPDLEVPSPTFTLIQTYACDRGAVAHFDLYRLSTADEVTEIGMSDAIDEGVVLIEWPERAGDELPDERLDITFTIEGDGRLANLTDTGAWIDRLDRTLAIRHFLAAEGGRDALRQHVQGDVSSRRYERIVANDATSRILMDWPRIGPPQPDSYDARAARARSVDAFIAIAGGLRGAGLSAPVIHAADQERGFMILEDFGRDGIVLNGNPDPDRYRVAVEALAELHALPRPTELAAPGGGTWRLPHYSRDVMAIELDLFSTHYLPFAGVAKGLDEALTMFDDIWVPLHDLIKAAEVGWVLRDVHSPNMMWLNERTGIRRVGLLDFQDALVGPSAYDVVSLLQDARATVSPDLERDLKAHYVGLRQTVDPDFDATAFSSVYAILGAQRNLKILGIFARLATRAGKPEYLAHLPRCRAYLARNLVDPVLSDLALWYEGLMLGDTQNHER